MLFSSLLRFVGACTEDRPKSLHPPAIKRKRGEGKHVNICSTSIHFPVSSSLSLPSLPECAIADIRRVMLLEAPRNVPSLAGNFHV